MVIKKHRFISFTFVMLLIFTSCKKDNNVQNPVFQLNYPLVNSFIAAPDTIEISYSIDNISYIDYVRISIDNSNFVPISNTVFVYPETIFYTGKVSIVLPVINNKQLLPPYYIHTVISDGNNEFHYYNEVQINNSLPTFKGFITSAGKSSSKIDITRYSEDFSAINSFEIIGEYISSSASNNFEYIYLATNAPSLLQAINYNTSETIWISEPQLPYPGFNNIIADDYTILVSTDIGRVIGLTEAEGLQIFNTQITKDTVPDKIIATDNFILTSNFLRTSNDMVLVSYHKKTGIVYNWVKTSFLTIGFTNSENNTVVIFGIENNSTEIIWFDIVSNEIIHSQKIDNVEMTNKCDISDNTIAFTADNSAYILEINTGIYNKIFESDSPLVDIEYEQDNELLLICNKSELFVINTNDYKIVRSIKSHYDLNSIDLIYQY